MRDRTPPYARSVLFEALEVAIDELPDAQRDVFVAHELEGRSFKQIAAETAWNVNTLLSRKRHAVQYLRSVARRLQTNSRSHRALMMTMRRKFIFFAPIAIVGVPPSPPSAASSSAAVERAAAGDFRLARDHVLVGSWPAGVVPDPV
jgi:hypothetical protein